MRTSRAWTSIWKITNTPKVPRFLLHSARFKLQPRSCLVCAVAIMQICPVLFASLLFPLRISSLAIEPVSISFDNHNNTLLNQSLPSDRTNPHLGYCSLIIDRPDLSHFNQEACTEAIPIACSNLTFFEPEYPLRDRWIWTNLPGCSLAFFVPMAAEWDILPTKQQCEVHVFGFLVELCVPSNVWNLGKINVFSPPTPGDPGRAWVQNHPRYLISPKQLDIEAPPL